MATYSFDTSAFIEPWVRHYPFDVAPSLWKRLDALAKQGVIVAASEVRHEIAKKHDVLHEWLAVRDHFFREPTTQVQHEVRAIVNTHQRLLGQTRHWSGADAWVIAEARASGHSVVTYEQWDPASRSIKIPDVCHDLGVECLTFVEFMRRCKITLKVAGK